MQVDGYIVVMPCVYGDGCVLDKSVSLGVDKRGGEVSRLLMLCMHPYMPTQSRHTSELARAKEREEQGIVGMVEVEVIIGEEEYSLNFRRFVGIYLWQFSFLLGHMMALFIASAHCR